MASTQPLAQLPDQCMSQKESLGSSYPTVPVFPEESVARAPGHVK